jgi:hypothetical protein
MNFAEADCVALLPPGMLRDGADSSGTGRSAEIRRLF